MGKLLSDKTANEVLQLIQAGKDSGVISAKRGRRTPSNNVFFELVTDLDDDLWGAKEQGYNTTANTWDDLDNGRVTTATVPLYVEGGGAAGDIVRAFPSRDTDGDPLWIAIRGGGSALSILKITAAGVNINTYTASIINNRTDETVITAGVTLKALDHSDGTIPNGVILTCTYDSVNEFYEPTNYPVFYGS